WVKLTTTERFSPRTHSRARMTKLATGIARISCMTGSTKIRTRRHRAPAAPSTSPPATASRKPARMRRALNAMRCQNPAVGAMRASAASVCTGVARNSPPCPRVMAAACHKTIQTARAASRSHRPGARSDAIVEVVAGQGAAHAGGVGVVEDLEVVGQVGFHLLPGLKDDVALRQRLLRQ